MTIDQSARHGVTVSLERHSDGSCPRYVVALSSRSGREVYLETWLPHKAQHVYTRLCNR